MTTRQKGLNACWLLLMGLPVAGGVAGCIARATGVLGYACGIVAALILAGALYKFAPKWNRVAPKELADNSVLAFFAAYVPIAIGYWQGGLGLTVLIHPVSVYLFIGCSERLHEWARAAGPSA